VRGSCSYVVISPVLRLLFDIREVQWPRHVDVAECLNIGASISNDGTYCEEHVDNEVENGRHLDRR
jgi:hypothetical protein